MASNIRKIGALCFKDFKDLFKNPTMLVSLLMPIAFAAFFRFMMGRVAGEMALEASGDAAAQAAQAAMMGRMLSSVLCMCIGMVVGMTVLYGIAEEKEKHTLRTLMLANVSAGQIAFSRGLVALVATAVVEVACFFVLGADPELLDWYLRAGLLGALPVVFISLIFGLMARDQMTAGLYSVPVVIVALLPMFGMYGEGIAAVATWLPTGGADVLVRIAAGGGSWWSSDGFTALGVCLAWSVAGAVGFKLLYKRLAQDN